MDRTGTVDTGDDRYQLESPRSPDRQVIPRRFPRIGSQFQTRIGKSTEPLDRRPPDRMSTKYPYATEHEVNRCRDSDFLEMELGDESPSHPIETNDFNGLKNHITRRGGTIVHAPTRESKQYKIFVQPFITSLKTPPQNQITPQAWVQHMIQLHSTEGAGKRKRVQRGAVKRKRENEEELVWSLESILQSQQESRRRKKAPRISNGEEEAVALDFLGQHFLGNVQTAVLNVVADLSGGQAAKMQKCEERIRARLRPKAAAANTSAYWRDMYEQIAFPLEATFLGKAQDKSGTHYLADMKTQLCESANDFCNHVEIALDSDDLKGAWRAILACGKSIERQLNGELPGRRKPYLSTLLTFVGNAYRLPLPESCFGTHHVVIEEVSSTMTGILQQIQKAKDVQSRILDKIFNEAVEGIDSEALLKFLDNECESLPIILPEASQLYESRAVVVEWEARLSSVLDNKELDSVECEFEVSLQEAERFREEAKSHGYFSKALINLISRIRKAHSLRARILQWKDTFTKESKGSLKTLFSIVKDIYRIKLGFCEAAEALELHRVAERWIDQASVAIRSKVSFSAIRDLVSDATNIPLDLSEYLDKLNIRLLAAEQWLDALEEVVPFKHFGNNKLEWMSELNSALHGVDQVSLHELSSEGNRIPVVVDEAKILQIAFDAKNWTAKANGWNPCTVDGKKGKLTDLEEHLEKLAMLRDRLPLPDPDKMAWAPAVEKDLLEIVGAANSWLEKYKDIITDEDAPSSKDPICVSVIQLREIVGELNQIHVNVGPPASKIAKILAQAETWYSSHVGLLRRCRLLTEGSEFQTELEQQVEPAELEVALQDAESNVSLQLEEALKLRKLLEKANNWRQQVSLIAPKRSKRSGKSARSRLTLEDLISLIAESTDIPIDTDDDVHRLQIQLSTVEAWRSQVSTQLEGIIDGFQKLQSRVRNVYGEAEDFGLEFYAKPSSTFGNPASDPCSSDHGNDALESDCDEDDVLLSTSGSDAEVIRQIKDLQEGAKEICVTTAEGELGDLLENVADWCVRSFKYLNDPKEIFDKRYFGAFDRFLSEGRVLLQKSGTGDIQLNGNGISRRVGIAWGVLVSGQLQRLDTLQKEREAFKEWCRVANSVLADAKSLSAGRLCDLANGSRRFPAATELVSKVRGLSAKVEKWTREAKEVLDSGKKLSVHDAQDLLEAGENLKVRSDTLKLLKEELDRAQNWLNKVGMYTSGEVAVNVGAVNELLKEYGSLLVELPEEVEELKQAAVGYCLCRRPYEGFMIGCDHCEEWYHGPCIGVSESKAGKFEKFACIRCAMKDVFDSSASAAVGLIRKWTCTNDLKKARQVDYQKIQRRFRKEKKDIEKFSNEMKEAEEQLLILINGKDNSRPRDASNVSLEDGSDDLRTEESCAMAMKEEKTTIGPQIEGHSHEILSLDVQPNGSNVSSIFPQAIDALDASSCTNQFDSMHSGERSFEAEQNKVTKKADIEARLHKAKVAILQAQERLEAISGQSRHRKFTEAKENELSVILRRWVLQVRSQVLVPSDVSKAELARPPFGVCLSQPMKDVVESASCLGLADLPDIPLMENYFKCMSWSLTALAFIRRKPSIEEVDYIISTSDGLRLPDERALRTLKYISNRANQIQIRCQKALSPKSGDTKSINISLLQEILKGAEELPVVVPETQILQLVIDDKGARHCYCGGPNDGLEMLRCDGCQKWFHRGCVGGDASPIEENWLCQSCGGANRDSRVENTPSRAFEPKEPSTMDPTTSPHAPDPKKLWPPFGLLGSKKAVHALGPECSAIAEGSDVLPSEQQEHSGTLGTQLTTAQNKIPSSTVTSDTSQLQIERMEARRPSENSASTALNGGTSVSGEAKDANSTDHAFLETRPLGFL